MKKITIVSAVLSLALTTHVASAQTYYPPATYANSYSSCLNLTSDLSIGYRNYSVRSLQNFLVSRNYPGGGSWMVSGYFGRATATAVRNFQQEQGLASTGFVDSLTRQAIARVSCGGSMAPTYNPIPVNQYPYNTYNNYNQYPYGNTYNNNSNNQYPYNNNYNNQYQNNNNYATVTLTSLSNTYGAAGTVVTAYGSGFDVNNNTVYIGGQALSNIASYNGNTLTFTVPSNLSSGNVQIYVWTTHGTSNSMTFNVTGTTYNNGCTGYSYNTNCTCNTYQYPYNCNNNTGTLSLTSINPTSGAVGSTVTVYGNGFSTTNNTVHFGGGIITGLSSYDGRSVSFVVPTQLVGYSSQVVTIGSYNVYVTNSLGQNSNILPFNVTNTGTSLSAPTFVSVNGPTTLTTGSTGTWNLVINNLNNSYFTTSVTWGDTSNGYVNMQAPLNTYGTGNQSLQYTHAFIAPGTYTVVFTASNSSGYSNTYSTSVYVSGTGTNSGSVTLSYIAPISGRVGTQVMLQGTGFTAYDNTVHFGTGGTLHVPSQNNGTTIYYTIPYGVSPCDLIGSGCAAPTTQVQTGSYQIYVSNTVGTSGTQNFTVTQ